MFSLVGGKHEEGMRETGLDLGSILHGFGKEFLAESWGLDMSDVEEILYSQKGVGIIKAEREVDIHRMARDEEQDSKEAAGGSTGENFGDFVYNVRHSTPDLMVEEAGFATVVNKFKLPVLQYMKMGLSYGRLERVTNSRSMHRRARVHSQVCLQQQSSPETDGWHRGTAFY